MEQPIARRSKQDRSSSAPLHLFPIDVLRIIFASFSLDIRLRLISPVCKRWRSVVLHTVSALELCQPRDRRVQWEPICILSLFPSLTDLTLSICELPVPLISLPMSLHSLRFVDQCESSSSASSVGAILQAPFPAFSRLSFRSSASRGNSPRPITDLLAPLLEASQSTLTVLHLWLGIVSHPIEQLVFTFYPLLTELALHCDVQDDQFLAFRIAPVINRYSTQLTSLAITCRPQYGRYLEQFGQSISLIAFPKLTYLRVTGNVTDAITLTRLLANCPLLTDLGLSYDRAVLDALDPSAIALVTKLHCDWRKNEDFKSHLASMLSLREMDEVCVSDESPRTLVEYFTSHGYASLVRRMRIEYCYCAREILPAFTNLTDVTLAGTFVVNYLLPLPHMSLPQLATLAVEEHGITCKYFCDFLRQISRICPVLASISADNIDLLDAVAIKKIGKLLTRRRHVTLLRICAKYDKDVPAIARRMEKACCTRILLQRSIDSDDDSDPDASSEQSSSSSEGSSESSSDL